MININIVLKRIILIGLGITAFLPLHVANSFFFPFITGKAFVFRIIIEIVFALWIVLILRERGTGAHKDKSILPRFNSLTITVTAFTVIALIADLFGLNPLRSIWSNFERMEGWIIIIHLWAYFMVLSSILTTKENWHTFFNVVLIAGFITAFYGLLQFFGWADTHQGSRVDALLGNSAYMAIYMLMNALLSSYMAVTSYAKKNLVWIYSIAAVFFSFIMFQTATRGTAIGWTVAIIISAILYVCLGKKKKGQSNLSRMLVGGGVLLVILAGLFISASKNSAWVKQSEVLDRLATISISDTKTQARGFVWPMALKGSFSNVKTAIIGIGQENFNYIFNENYNPQMYAHEQWFDRAHSVFIDWLVASGLLGLIAYIALYILSFIYIWKSDLTLGQKSILTGLFVGYGIHNVFVFDNQTSYVMFFTVLAFVHSLKSGKTYSWLVGSKKSTSENAIVMRDYVFTPLIVLGLVAALYFINIRNIQANTRLIDSLRACSNGGTPSTALFERALALNQTTANQEIREQLVSCAANVMNSQQAPAQLKNGFYLLAKQQIEKQIVASPDDARVYMIAGSFFNSIGDFASALPILEKAHQLSPGKQTISFELSTTYMNMDMAQKAVDVVKQAYDSAPENPLSKSAYVMVLINADQEARARELFPNNPELFTDQRVINVYAQKKQFKKIIDIYKKLIAGGKNDVQTYFFLVTAYLADKQNFAAVQELKNIIVKFPETKTQIEAVIKDIEAGKNVLGE